MHDLLVTKTLIDMSQLSHQFATECTGNNIHVDAAYNLSSRRSVGTQALQPGDPSLRPGAAGLNTFANPHLFLRQ